MILKCSDGEHAYLFIRQNSKQVYVAKLDEVDIISQKLGIPKDETLQLLLKLVKERMEKQQKMTLKN